MHSLEYIPIPFLLGAVSRAFRLDHGHVAARWREHVVCINGLLPWFDAVLDSCSLMALLLRAWQQWCWWSTVGDGCWDGWEAGYLGSHLFLECLAQ
jgi:hypothetical protein